MPPPLAAPRRWRWPHWLALLLGLAASGAGLWHLLDARRGLAIEAGVVADIPITVFRPARAEASARAPVVVIGHGFAGSEQLMHPFAQTLARDGFISITFDFPGHGRNATPLAGELGEPARTAALLAALGRVVEHARALPGGDGRLALLGHSMAGDIAVRHARTDADITALVAVSPYLSEPMGPDRPARVLFVYGGLEPAVLQDQGRRAIAASASLGASPGAGAGAGLAPTEIERDRTYGEGPAARRLVIADGAEHIGVLYSAVSLVAARDWLRAAFGRDPDAAAAPVDARGGWFALYVLGALLVALPLARLLPRVVAAPAGLGAGLGWRRLLPVAVAPALLTPLLLMPLPTDFLAIVIGDYLALHFAVYGLLTAAGLWAFGGLRGAADAAQTERDDGPAGHRPRWGALALAVLAVGLFQALAFTLPTDRFIASFIPGPGRLDALAVLFAAALVWTLTDEWLTRGPRAPRGAYPLTKALFLVSLLLAVVLNRNELFFLVLVVPAILALFIVYGLMSRWVFQATGHPAVAAVTNALAFAAAVAVTFPVLG